ncbi:hypothetical protein AOR04_02680 [Pseudoalteromonas sp. 1_2015MBL_MicDiv]|nr:hypothetical protein AOR04_02680 [Pseudoalteromonas sp. 1_2015MBL_MicDiv]
MALVFKKRGVNLTYNMGHRPVGANLFRAHVTWLGCQKARYKTSPTTYTNPVGANLFRAHVMWLWSLKSEV